MTCRPRVLGQDVALPVLISPTGVQAVHPDGEVAVARAAANRGVAMGLSSFASKPVEEVAAANPQTFFQLYWCGTREQIAPAGRTRPGGRRGRVHRDPGLVLLDGRDWGSPYIPERITAARGGAVRARGADQRPRWLTRVRQDQAHPGSDRAEHAGPGAAGADLLRRVRAVDADPAAVLGRRGVAAVAVGRAVPGQGRHPRRRRETRRRCRRLGDLGVQPRRQQPRRHPGHHPGAARDRRRGRRSGRGAARRRHPARQRRGEGAGPRRPRRAHRPRLPVGARRQRAGRGRERAGHHARRGSTPRCSGSASASVRDLHRDDVLIPEGFTRTLGVPA